MLRVCQQALHNSLIHAQPQIIHIKICVNDDKVAFTIEDDGRGFVLLPIEKLAAAYHFGLYIMTVRLQQLGDR
jgi:nitrate/nitrite-specific signal transduction histidine kinase